MHAFGVLDCEEESNSCSVLYSKTIKPEARRMFLRNEKRTHTVV